MNDQLGMCGMETVTAATWLRRMALLVVWIVLAHPALAKPLRVAYRPSIGFSPLNVAEALGYWKEQGIQVQLVPFDDTKAEIKSLVEGDVDVAGGIMGDFVGWEVSGAPIKLTAETHWSAGSAKLVLKPGMSAAHLAGQTIGIGYREDGLALFLNRYLNANGLRYADIKTQEGTPDQLLAAFEKGQLAGVVLTDPDASIARQHGVVAVDSAVYDKLVVEGFAASNTALASVPDATWVKFYRGWLKGVGWVRGNGFSWGAYRKMLDPTLYHKTFADGDSAAMETFSNVKFPSVFDSIKQHGALGELEYHVRTVLRFLLETGQVKTEPEARPLIQSHAFEQALKEMK